MNGASPSPESPAASRSGWSHGWRVTVPAAVCGLLAVGTGVLAGEFLSTWLSPSLTPLNAVGGMVIDAVPAPVKEWAIASFGTSDKTVFGILMRVIAGLLAALAGILELRRRRVGVLLVAAVGVVAASAGAVRPDGGAVLAVLGLLSGVVAAVVLSLLITRLGDWARSGSRTEPAHGSEGEVVDTASSRRRFLGAVAASAVGVAVLAAGTAVARGARNGYQTARAALKLPAPAKAAPPAPADLPVPGISPWATPNGEFYRIDTALVVPFVDPATWTLKVTGLVDREVTLSFDELLTKPLRELDVTLACVSNEVGGDLVGNARWLGWPVRELLAQAGVRPGADMVLSRSVDGFTASTPLEALSDARGALLAIGMNGEPLPPEHGFPVRLVVPGLYGYVSATKWVTELKVTTFAQDMAYWTSRGWSDHGPIKRSSRIDTPRQGATVPRDGVIGGVAWAQGTGVASVDVRLDDGAWQPARLGGDGGTDSWRQWSLPLAALTGGAPAGGEHRLTVRMTGRDGRPQSTDLAPPAPNGSSGLHTITFRVG